jgi:pimeloyl-ACP methyl ester carboxylesterase
VPARTLIARACALAGVLAALCVLAAQPAAAAAGGDLARASCTTSFDIAGAHCRTLRVPIDASGKVPGSVNLFIERVPAEHPSKTAMVVFPGGPGASTTLLAHDELAAVRAGLADHDLLLFDQRGTGRSDYLDCDVALTPSYFVPPGDLAQQLAKVVQRCAKRLGPRRSFYTTRQTVDDLESIRRAYGYDKLDLIGVSYGTRDALEYARIHPDRVERVVLDSLVGDPGVDAFGLPSTRAIPRVLQQLCRGGGCKGITDDPVGDLEALVAKLATAPLRSARAVSFAGCRLRPAITRSQIYTLFAQADEDPELLAQLPVAVNQAVHGNLYPLAQLEALQSPYLLGCGLEALLGQFGGKSIKEDVKLFAETFSAAEQIATLCEETPLPWPRDSLPSQRRRDAEEFLAPLPDSAFAPFDRATMLATSLVPLCKFWLAAPQPPDLPTGPLPAVPTLILTGLDDLRTPGEDALALARQTPTAQLLTVPDVGHSILTSSGCARRAFARFMKDETIAQCHRYPQHRPLPARGVADVFQQLERLLGSVGSG